MALQGTIDAFPLTDVLQLLSSSARSGRLLLEGDRGRAELWLEDGSVVGADLGVPVRDAAQAVFEMLRFRDGSFVFDVVDGTPQSPVDAAALSDCAQGAVELLEEWRRIEEVLPTQQHLVRLRPELGDAPVTIDAAEWRVLVSCGDIPTVAECARRLALDELAAGAALAALVQRDLLVIDEPDAAAPDTAGPDTAAPDAAAPDTVLSVDASSGADEPWVDQDPASAEVDTPDEAGPADTGFPERFPIDDLLGADQSDGAWSGDDGDTHRFAAAQTFEPLGADAFSGERPEADQGLSDRTAEAWDEVVSGQVPVVEEPWQELPAEADQQQAVDDTADEVLRQMSRLSPKAAEAIAAALSSPSSAPVIASEPERRDDDGPVSFLGSF